jgi:hypothetical protein
MLKCHYVIDVFFRKGLRSLGLSFVFVNPGKSVLLTFIMVTFFCIFFTMFQVTDASFKQVIKRILTSIVLP